MRLPLLAEGVHACPPAEQVATQRGSRPLRLLVVDDHHDTAQSMALVMRAYGHQVATAASGPEALELVVAELPEVVLTDIGLPGGLDGYEVARRIRSHSTLPQPVLIAITGYGQETDRERARTAGFDHHVVKPVDLAELQGFLAGLGLNEPPAS